MLDKVLNLCYHVDVKKRERGKQKMLNLKKEFVFIKIFNQKGEFIKYDVCSKKHYKEYILNAIDHSKETYFAIPCRIEKLKKLLNRHGDLPLNSMLNLRKEVGLA